MGRTGSFTKQIGSTTFTVNVHFSEKSHDTIEDKILHIIKNDILTNRSDCATISLSQADWLSERTAV
jgi:hypothetical protein